MERRGLVKVTANPEDRRSRVMSLTAKGRKLLARAVPIWTETHAEVDGLIADFGPDRLREALRSLSAIATKTDPA